MYDLPEFFFRVKKFYTICLMNFRVNGPAHTLDACPIYSIVHGANRPDPSNKWIRTGYIGRPTHRWAGPIRHRQTGRRAYGRVSARNRASGNKVHPLVEKFQFGLADSLESFLGEERPPENHYTICFFGTNGGRVVM